MPNSKRRRVTTLVVNTPYVSPDIHARLDFNDDRDRPISYHLTGDDAKVLVLGDKLDEYLLGVRPWYSILARFSFVSVLIGFYLLVTVLASLLWVADALFPQAMPGELSYASDDNSPVPTTVIVVVILAILSLGAALDKWVIGKLFPAGTFAIGQGQQRYETLRKIRAGAITVVGLPSVFFILSLYLE